MIENFVNGSFKPSSSGRLLDVVSPSTGERVAQVTLSTKEVWPRVALSRSSRRGRSHAAR
jgi:acyl-CoA reductase-like NAD-dependent aldehyde dehydrogenase